MNKNNWASYLAGFIDGEGNSRGGRVKNDPIRGTGTWLFMPDEKE